MYAVLQNLLKYIQGNLITSIQEFLLNQFQNLMVFMNNSLWEFWNEPMITAILDTTFILSLLSLAIGCVFLISDIAEQCEQIDIKIVLFSLAKGFIFAVSARWIALSFFYGANIFVNALNIKLDSSEILNVVKGNASVGLGSTVFLLLILVIALAVFFFLQIGRFAAMLIHIISAFAYIPFIVCGDSQKMKDWSTMALSIALTYALQYLSFYGGVALLTSGKSVSGLVLIVAAFSAAKELKNLGHTTGTANTLRGSASMAYQAVIGLKSIGGA